MIIIQDEHQFKAESTTSMMPENNSIISQAEDEEVEINDLSSFIKQPQEDLLKSSNKRKQIKPNRVTNEVNPNGNVSSSPTSTAEAYCNLCERSFCNKYFLKTHFAKKHGVLNPVSPSSSPPSNVSPEQSSPNIIDPKLSEDYCEICQKRFCNKYYLRKHKGECHGIYTDYIKSLQKTNTDSPTKIPRTTPFYLSSTDESSDSISTIRRCHLCQEEFRNRALLRLHMSTVHPTEQTKKKSSLTPVPSSNLGFLQPYVDTSSPLAHKLVAGQAPPSSYGILHDSYFCAKMADRVVCEICNKQVCNKYFLKTHKAKVHGITSNNHSNGHQDSLPPTMVPIPTTETNENESEIENYCSICQKDFSNKYLYLFHMQTMHNDTSDPSYQTLVQLMKAAAVAAATNVTNVNPIGFSSLPMGHQSNDDESEDESDGSSQTLKRKRSSSQSSTEQNKRLQTLNENNGGLQPFLLESEDPTFADCFVPCMVYLPVVRRVTKQVKLHLRLKPVLTTDN